MILFVILLLGYTPIANAACNATQMKTCYKTYFNDFGLSNAQFPPTFDAFDGRYRQLTDGSKDAVDKTCGYYKNLYKCLDSTSDCITWDKVAQALDNVDNRTAAQYVENFFSQQYICGDGLQGYKQLFNCSINSLLCEAIPEECDKLMDWYNCYNKIANATCGEVSAAYTCNSEIIISKYMTGCSYQSLNCDIFTPNAAPELKLVTAIISVILSFACLYF